MPDLFISYFTEERERASALAAALAARDTTSFVDHVVIELGDDLEHVIARQVERCAAMVVLWSGHDAPERWVRREHAIAVGARARVIVVRLCDAEPPGGTARLFEDARATWLDPAAVPPPLVEKIVRATRPIVEVVTGDEARTRPLASALARADGWRDCELHVDDPFRAGDWIATRDPWERVVCFVDVHESMRGDRAIEFIGAARRADLRLKPIFFLLEDDGEPHRILPSWADRYFRTPRAATGVTLARDWRRVRQEWDDKPRTSPYPA